MTIIVQFSSDKIINVTFPYIRKKEYFRLEVTIFASLFDTFNVCFHNLQIIIEQVVVQLGLKDGWDLKRRRE